MQPGLLPVKEAKVGYPNALFRGYADIVNAAPPHY
jgi:hypothetical protein